MRGGGGGGGKGGFLSIQKKQFIDIFFFTIDVKIRGVAPIRNVESMNCNFFCYVR